MNISDIINSNVKWITLKCKVREYLGVKKIMTTVGEKNIFTYVVEDDSGKINLSIFSHDEHTNIRLNDIVVLHASTYIFKNKKQLSCNDFNKITILNR